MKVIKIKLKMNFRCFKKCFERNNEKHIEINLAGKYNK